MNFLRAFQTRVILISHFLPLVVELRKLPKFGFQKMLGQRGAVMYSVRRGALRGRVANGLTRASCGPLAPDLPKARLARPPGPRAQKPTERPRVLGGRHPGRGAR